MCTAVTYNTQDHYFGRNLDVDFSHIENLTVTPRNFPLKLRFNNDIYNHYAILGMAYVHSGYPLYYDGVNEKGLAASGLRFAGFTEYMPIQQSKSTIAPFELIPYILCRCSCIEEVIFLLETTCIADIDFSDDLPATPLHWMFADKKRCIVVECTVNGLRIYDNPIGILTNAPEFENQLFNLNNYMSLSIDTPKNLFSPGLKLSAYSRGMGALGLPGDMSSMSRFVRTAFAKENSVSGSSEEESVNQLFHILTFSEQIRGCTRLPDGKYEVTLYSSCINMDKCIYYYKTYENSQITAVNLYNENLNSTELIVYPIFKSWQIRYMN